MISLLLAIISFVVQIPVKTAILAKEVALKGNVDTVHTSISPVKEKSKSRLQALKEKLTKKKTTDKKSSKKEKVKRLVIKALKTVLLFLKSCVCLFSVLCFIVSLLTVFAGVFLFLILGTVAVIILNNKTAFTTSNVAIKHETKIQTADTSSLVACCKTMAEWYIKNVHTYQNRSSGKGSGERKWYTCDLVRAKVGDDCTGFAAAYVMLVTGKKLSTYSSGDLYASKVKDWVDAGWTRYTITELGGTKGLQAGDILVCNYDKDKNCIGHHAEVYLKRGKTFGWGKIRKSYPSGHPKLTNVKKDGNKIYISDGGYHTYGVVWRYTGGKKK